MNITTRINKAITFDNVGEFEDYINKLDPKCFVYAYPLLSQKGIPAYDITATYNAISVYQEENILQFYDDNRSGEHCLNFNDVSRIEINLNESDINLNENVVILYCEIKCGSGQKCVIYIDV